MIQHNKLVSTPLHKEYFSPTVKQSLAHKQPYSFVDFKYTIHIYFTDYIGRIAREVTSSDLR